MDRYRFDQLVREHLPRIHRLAIRLCGDLARGEDVAQEALLRAARAWPLFREEASFHSWVYRLTVNAWRDHLRRRIGPDALDAEPADPRTSDPPDDAAARELAEIVAARVSSLPPRQREVLILVAFEDHSITDAARVLEISEQNVRTTLHLAREKLRAQLAPYLNVEAIRRAESPRDDA